MQSLSQMDSPKHDDVQEFTTEPAHLSDFTLHFRSASYHLHRVTLFAESKYFAVLLSPDAQVTCNKDYSLTSRCQQPDHHCVSLPDSQIGGTEVTANELMDFLEHVAYGVNRKDMHRWRRALKVNDYVDYEDSKDQWCLAQVSEVSVGGLVTVRYTVNDQSAVESEKLNSEKLQQAFARTDQCKWRLSLQLDDDIACCDTQKKWLAARIIAKEDSRVRVHYIDWDPIWQEWIEIHSIRLAPFAYVYRDDIDISDEPVGLKMAHYFDTPAVLRYFTKEQCFVYKDS